MAFPFRLENNATVVYEMRNHRVLAVDVGVRNLGLAAGDVEPEGVYLTLLEACDIAAASSDGVICRAWDRLDAIVTAWSPAPGDRVEVLVEMQPAKGRSVMRCLEAGIRHYFLMCARRSPGVTFKVVAVSSRKKLSQAPAYTAAATAAQRYKQRKDQAVREARAVLADVAPRFRAALDCKKPDDMADALCYLVRRYPGVVGERELSPPCVGATNAD